MMSRCLQSVNKSVNCFSIDGIKQHLDVLSWENEKNLASRRWLFSQKSAPPSCSIQITVSFSSLSFRSAGEERVQRRAPFVPLLRRWRDGRIQHQAQAHEARPENSRKCHREVSAGEWCAAVISHSWARWLCVFLLISPADLQPSMSLSSGQLCALTH